MFKRRWVLITLALLLIGGGVVGVKMRARGKKSAGPAKTELVSVTRGPVRKTVTADGTLRPWTTVDVKSYAGGRIELLAVDIGDRVKAGDLIAKIDPTDSKTALDQAAADLNSAKAKKNQAVGQAGAQTEITRASVAQAAAAYQAAQEDLARLRQATQPHARTDAQSTLARSLAAVEASQRDLERLRLGVHPTSHAQAQAALEKSTAALESAERDVVRLRNASQPQTRATAKSTLDRSVASLESAVKDLHRLQEAGHPQARVQTASTLEKSRWDLSVAEKELNRSRGLKAQDLISQSQLDVAEAKYEQARADYGYAQERSTTLPPDQTNELRSVEMSVARARADLAAAQTRWDTLDTEQSADLRVAQLGVTQSQADRFSAQQRRNTIDAEQTAEIKAAEAKVTQARADLDTARNRWDLLDLDQKTEAQAAQGRTWQAQAALEEARAKSVQDQVSKLEVQATDAAVVKAAAGVNSAQIFLGYTTITAPRDGVVLQRAVEQGTIIASGRSSVTTGTTIITLGDVSRMLVDVPVDESDLSGIHLKQRVDLAFDAYPDEKMWGTVWRINPQATTASNITTVLIEVEVNKPTAKLVPGITATCSFLVDEKPDVLSLPNRAVKQAGKNATVKVVEAGQVTEKPVKIGLRGNESTEIVDGLKEGDQVLMPKLGAPQQSSKERMQDMGKRMGGGGLSR